jgi:hypothetical protein
MLPTSEKPSWFLLGILFDAYGGFRVRACYTGDQHVTWVIPDWLNKHFEDRIFDNLDVVSRNFVVYEPGLSSSEDRPYFEERKTR